MAIALTRTNPWGWIDMSWSVSLQAATACLRSGESAIAEYGCVMEAGEVEEESLLTLLLLPTTPLDDAGAVLVDDPGGLGSPPPPPTDLPDEALGNVDDRRRVKVATTT
jgi:hypothetical protein